jgi:selenocysteine lyase/cysteine desulfurase
VPYAADGSRFLGATFDVSALYRFNAVQDWLKDRSVAEMLEHVRGIERVFLKNVALEPMIADESRRGRFLTFKTQDAGAITETLAAKNIIVDHRGDRLRVGFGIYHTEDDALRLAASFA